MINHGLAPYFAEELTTEIKESGKIVACFDEASNNVAQRGQMDISIRFWNVKNSRVSTRYFNSVFLNHARAEHLLAGFKQGMRGILLSETMQVSVDGPNVNWKFIELLEDDENFTKNGKQLLELESCGLHAVHGAFQTGHKAAEWNVNEVLRSFCHLFKDSPIKRTNYVDITGSSVFPKTFCQTRYDGWKIQLLPKELRRYLPMLNYILKKYPKSCKSAPASFVKSQDAVKDPLTLARTAFFGHNPHILEPFLRTFQTNKPMVPFVYSELEAVLRALLGKILKREPIEMASTAKKLLTLNTDEHLRPIKSIDIGVATSSALSKVQSLIHLS